MSKRLFIYDLGTNLNYLIDTGADILVMPPTRHYSQVDNNYHLFPENGSPIKTYGKSDVILTLGLRREFPWKMVIADVIYPILEAGFLSKYGLLGNLQFAICSLQYSLHSWSSDEFANILIRRACKFQHRVQHVIETTGQPLAGKARRLPPHKLRATREIFKKLLAYGDIRPSKSPWASPIRVRPKKGTTKWRVCGDFRGLSCITCPVRYPIPNILDFNSQLAGTRILERIIRFRWPQKMWRKPQQSHLLAFWSVWVAGNALWFT